MALIISSLIILFVLTVSFLTAKRKRARREHYIMAFLGAVLCLTGAAGLITSHFTYYGCITEIVVTDIKSVRDGKAIIVDADQERHLVDTWYPIDQDKPYCLERHSETDFLIWPQVF